MRAKVENTTGDNRSVKIGFYSSIFKEAIECRDAVGKYYFFKRV